MINDPVERIRCRLAVGVEGRERMERELEELEKEVFGMIERRREKR